MIFTIKKRGFKSVRQRLSFYFLFVALLPLVLFSFLAINERISAIKKQETSKLEAIRDLKVRQINSWIDERLGDIKSFSEDSRIQHLSDIFYRANRSEKDLNYIKEASEFLYSIDLNFDLYDELFLINPETGIVEVSTNPALVGLNRSTNPYYTEPLKNKELYIKGIFYSKSLDKPSMTFSLPVYCKNILSSILVTRVALDISLFAMLSDRIGMGSTGETYVFNFEGYVLSELRQYEHAYLRIKINDKAFELANQGGTGIIECADYRNEKVLAAYAYLPSLKWGLIAKQDIYEILAPLRLMIVNILFLFVILLLLIYGVALFLSRSISMPLYEMTKVAKNIQSGDISIRIDIKTDDELGYLANTINNMADSLSSQIDVHHGVSQISEILVTATDMTTFRIVFLKVLLDVTESQFGVYYVLSPNTSLFEPFHSIGVQPDLLEPFDAKRFEGWLGEVLLSKTITLRTIPEQSVFTYKTFLGSMIPKEIVSIPIIVEDEIIALISLGKITRYSINSIDILNQSWPIINTAIANILANERTRSLAKELNDKNIQFQIQAQELHKQAQQLQKQNLELDEQRKHVEEANRLKGEFIANMSHELRTPLNSIIALAKILSLQIKDRINIDEISYIQVIERNGRKLLELINDILDLSKIQAGKMSVVPKLFSLNALIVNIHESLMPLAKEKNIEFNATIPDDLPQIESDEMRLHQVLYNIVGNAVKFTENGSVNISVRCDIQKFIIKIKDTGIGIHKEHIPSIFQEFRQLDGSSSRRYEGTGLGLAIAYRCTQLLGGKIEIESELGRGSCFTIILPVWWKETQPNSAVVVFDKQNEMDQVKKTILIVDDEPENTQLISDFLIKEGYQTITTTSGKEGVRLAKKYNPFAISLDVVMPEMDGWEVLQNLKDDSETSKIPVIIVSISNDKETGFALGAVGHINKPMKKEMLIEEIKKICRKDICSVLIVDDNEFDRTLTAKILEQENININTAKNGKECMEVMKNAIPDLIILDLIMPEMDGFEVLEKLRTTKETQCLPVIITTAKDLTPEDRKKLYGRVSAILSKTEQTPLAFLKVIKKLLRDLESAIDKCPESNVSTV